MDSKKIQADFQFVASRVSHFSLETKDIATEEIPVRIDSDIDYNILNIEKNENNHVGVIEFTAEIKSKVKKSYLFKISVKMEAIFVGNPHVLTDETFKNRLELNGVATLSQMCRSFVLSTTALAGINPPIKIPMVNIQKLRDLKKNNEN
jgi:preprotein translocase subunit SecB